MPDTTRDVGDVQSVLALDATGRRKRATKTWVRWLVAIVVVAGIVAAIVVVRRKQAVQGPSYVTQKVAKNELRVTVTTTGNTKSSKTVEIGAEVTGKVLHVDVDFNEHVTKGQLLAELDPEQLRAAADEASAQVLAAAASVKSAEATVLETKQAKARAEEQAAQGLIAKKDLETAIASLARAEASLSNAVANANLARAGEKNARSKLDKTKIVSPIDGVVLSRSVEPGQTVTAGFTTPVLFTVAADLRKLTLEVAIDEADVGRVREGMDASFTVDAYPTRTFPSKVVSVHYDPTTSSNVVTYLAVLSVDNADLLLRPGMTATATVVSEVLSDVLVVPNAALRFLPPVTAPAGFAPGPPQAVASPMVEGDAKHVYVLRGGKPAMATVKTGASDGRMTEVVSGSLAIGDEVITDAVTP